MLPIETIEQTPLLIKRLQRCINLCNNSMQEYQVLLKLLNLINKFVTGGFPGFGTLIICEVYNKNSVLTRMLSDPTNQLYQELLLLIRNVSVNCLYPSIDFEQELKELKKTHKISFPHKMFELLANNLHETIINEGLLLFPLFLLIK